MTSPAVLPFAKKRDDAPVTAWPRGARLTDTGNAERFAMQHAGTLRYCHASNAWFVWDGRRWTPDDSGEVVRLAKTTIRTLYADAVAAAESDRERIARHAIRSDSATRIEAMLRLAESEPEMVLRPADLDSDPWLLTVQNGTVDLRTGELREHRREDLLTKLIPVEYDPAATAPRWQAFLARVLARDEELIAFVERAVGYSLTGSVREQCFFFLFGPGGSGKSTFLEVLRALFADFAVHAEFATFLERKSERGPRDLARFVGARLVTATEAGERSRFNEAQIKSATGGDTLTACRLYESAFEYKPQFKPWLASNHKPTITGTDRGIWRRVRLIPFSVEIPESEFDRDLPEKLLAELPGILAWAVRGCLSWQRDGLGTPLRVAEATADYREESDVFARFISERCEISAEYTATAAALFAAYKEWALAENEKPMSNTMFGRKLAERGFKKDKSKRTSKIEYFGLRPVLDGFGGFADNSVKSPSSLSREGFPENGSNPPETLRTLSPEDEQRRDRIAEIHGEVVAMEFVRTHAAPPAASRVPGTCIRCGRTGLPDGAAICAGGVHLPPGLVANAGGPDA